MPRYPARVLPAGWQISRRAGGWYLQHQDSESGEWRDVNTRPYKRRGYAVDAWGRLEVKKLLEREGAQGHDD